MTNRNFSKGFAPAVIIIAVVLLLLGAGAGIYYFTSAKKTPPPNALVNRETKGAAQKAVESEINSVADLEVNSPEFDFSNSPLPAMAASSLNLNGGEVAGDNLFADVEVNDDFSYDKEVDIAKPSYDLGVEVAPSAPAEPPDNNPTPPETQAPTTDCSAFASAPSCSYVGATDSDAYVACKQCFPDK